MNIKTNTENEKVSITALNGGDVFRYDGDLFMRIKDLKVGHQIYMAVWLNCGTPCRWSDLNVLVEPVSGTFCEGVA